MHFHLGESLFGTSEASDTVAGVTTARGVVPYLGCRSGYGRWVADSELEPETPPWDVGLRQILKLYPDAGPWLARLVRKSLRKGSEIVIIFTAPDGFRLHFITVSGRLPEEADIELMAFSFMTKVVLEQTGKTLTDAHQIVAAAAPQQLSAVLEGMNLDKAPLWKRNPIPHWTADIKTGH